MDKKREIKFTSTKSECGREEGKHRRPARNHRGRLLGLWEEIIICALGAPYISHQQICIDTFLIFDVFSKHVKNEKSPSLGAFLSPVPFLVRARVA
jgi:hypothetical protein